MNKLLSLFKNTAYLLILVLIIIIVLQNARFCDHQKQGNDTIFQSDTAWQRQVDTVFYPKVIERPVPFYKDTGSFVVINQFTDTLSIIKDFLVKNIYKRTILDDSNGTIVLTDTVTQNRLMQGVLDARLYPRTTTIIHRTTTILPQRSALFTGLGIGLNPQRPGFYPSVLFLAKTSRVYSLGYDFINKDLLVSMYWKIQLKKTRP